MKVVLLILVNLIFFSLGGHAQSVERPFSVKNVEIEITASYERPAQSGDWDPKEEDGTPKDPKDAPKSVNDWYKDGKAPAKVQKCFNLQREIIRGVLSDGQLGEKLIAVYDTHLLYQIDFRNGRCVPDPAEKVDSWVQARYNEDVSENKIAPPWANDYFWNSADEDRVLKVFNEADDDKYRDRAVEKLTYMKMTNPATIQAFVAYAKRSSSVGFNSQGYWSPYDGNNFRFQALIDAAMKSSLQDSSLTETIAATTTKSLDFQYLQKAITFLASQPLLDTTAVGYLKQSLSPDHVDRVTDPFSKPKSDQPSGDRYRAEVNQLLNAQGD